MSDEEIRKLLKAALLLEDSPELTDSEVDAWMSAPADLPPETLERGRARIADKVLGSLHSEPVRQIQEKLTFGRWIEKIRKQAHLTYKFIAVALNQEPAFIEQLETGDLLPWKMKANDGADIISLFRVHIDAVVHLLELSLAVSLERAKGEEAIAARAHKGRPSPKRNESTRRAWDLYLAHKVEKAELTPEVINWLNEVREELRRRQATHLLQ
ncbi:MAG TPA: hypothetical protein VF658_21185 [Pyrinomonadaceae bacterium]